MRIAIVGAGISGLVAAYHLADEHELTVFEANDYIGGHTNTVPVDDAVGRVYVDTGFIVFNPSNYPNFSALLDVLGVESQPTEMSFSVRCDRSGLEYNGTNLNTVFAQRRNLLSARFWRMLRDILRFGREATDVLQQSGDSQSVDEFVRERGYGREFVHNYLLPLGASLWSCPVGTFSGFPIRFVVEFLDNHRMLQVSNRPQWRVVKGGSFCYVEKLAEGFRSSTRLRCPVVHVSRSADSVTIRDGNGEVSQFDHVVLACHADQALRMLTDPSPLEAEILESFPYQKNEAVLHTDTSVLPRCRRAWASWNYRRSCDDDNPVAVTYNMNLLQGLRTDQTYCVTLNDSGRIEPRQILRRFTYHHPMFTERRAGAQARHRELIDQRRTSFCGAYWGYGFHEDGVRSALAVCRQLRSALTEARGATQ
ncbi:MAG: FAD-dependent oxidoreductase [Planctomycetes bacterium]|nr:FAD-dependent oxidoreductase [Planctomycetota bacterium]